MKVLLAKVAALVHTKVALVVLGAMVVAGGGTAAAVAATHGQLPRLWVGAASATQGTQGTEGADGADPSQSNLTHTSAEGILKSYIAGLSITVQLHDGTLVTFAVNASTEVNGAHANTLADLPGVVGGRVQVQATKQSVGSFLATKITVQGGDTGDQTGPTVVHGTIARIIGQTFVVTTDGGSVTITVTNNTAFTGGMSGLADLKVGASVNVQGIQQPNGSVVATRIEGGK